MTDPMTRAIIADSKPLQEQYFRERAERESQMPHSGADITATERAEIDRLPNTTPVSTPAMSEIDRLTQVAKDVQDPPAPKIVMNFDD